MFHFYKTPGFLKKFSSNLIWDIPTEQNDIYLTFDDGPIPRLTEYVTDTLDKYDAEATFFCVGDNIAKYPDIFDMLLERGHRVGNHTFNHLKGLNTATPVYLENIKACESLIAKKVPALGKSIFRPPHGQITPRQIKMLKEEYKIIMWDILAYDFDQSHEPEKSLAGIISKTVPGSIVVFHDNFKAEKKLTFMLPRFLDYFKEKGFTFKKISG
jgi:peptidoglycan-N-acetylglucosamine deacetylase